MTDLIMQLSKELNVGIQQAQSAVELIDQGNTIPFIARYRKEVTGGLDDALLRKLSERLIYLRNLQNRREEVKRLIHEQGKLTDDIEVAIKSAQTMTELEDIYRPFKPKRRTRATIAREKGLDPLAQLLWNQELMEGDILDIAARYIDEEKGVLSADDAIEGAMDIVAEMISDNAECRKLLRYHTFENGILVTKAISEEKSIYEMYYDYAEAVKQIVPHRILAVNRGEREKYLSVKIQMDEQKALDLLYNKIITNPLSITASYIIDAAADAYKRLIAPSIEREIRSQLTEKAEEQAIKVFGENLRNLLLQPPVKGKVVMGIDPGFRTGNKVAVVDETGKVLDTGVVYMTLSIHDTRRAKEKLKDLILRHGVNVIAIGNGTASRETELQAAELIKEFNHKIHYVIVNEAGASVYSASEAGTEEFPDYDVAVRSAISIARRLQDPLAELVKIDPKAIGVGQYQHDVNQKRLAETLQGIVEYCVNTVGVDLNTASSSLLQYVSGISASVAKQIVIYRESVGKFVSRSELRKVKKLGPKAFEQCAGFLRIPGAKNILDNTAVHPESYGAVQKLLEIKNLSLEELGKEGLIKLTEEARGWNLKELAQLLGIGLPTLKDIIEELAKPGRDPRDKLPHPVLRTDVMGIEDLKPNMVLTGTVRNVIDFGAFVDIGVHQDGLVHISQLADRYVKHPMEVVQVGDIVQVKILEVDLERKRISLTMRGI